jgi:hypothetical protein
MPSIALQTRILTTVTIVVRVDEKLTAFLEPESAILACCNLS